MINTPTSLTKSTSSRRSLIKRALERDPAADFALEVFYDGDCPLCRREMELVRRLDRQSRIRLTNIALPEFSVADYGKEMDEFMSEIQGRTPGGQWVTGVEVFRRMYAALGFRWLAALSRLPGISHVTESAYRTFARNRLRWTGRCTEACSVTDQDSR